MFRVMCVGQLASLFIVARQRLRHEACRLTKGGKRAVGRRDVGRRGVLACWALQLGGKCTASWASMKAAGRMTCGMHPMWHAQTAANAGDRWAERRWPPNGHPQRLFLTATP